MLRILFVASLLCAAAPFAAAQNVEIGAAGSSEAGGPATWAAAIKSALPLLASGPLSSTAIDLGRLNLEAPANAPLVKNLSQVLAAPAKSVPAAPTPAHFHAQDDDTKTFKLACAITGEMKARDQEARRLRGDFLEEAITAAQFKEKAAQLLGNPLLADGNARKNLKTELEALAGRVGRASTRVLDENPELTVAPAAPDVPQDAEPWDRIEKNPAAVFFGLKQNLALLISNSDANGPSENWDRVEAGLAEISRTPDKINAKKAGALYDALLPALHQYRVNLDLSANVDHDFRIRQTRRAIAVLHDALLLTGRKRVFLETLKALKGLGPALSELNLDPRSFATMMRARDSAVLALNLYPNRLPLIAAQDRIGPMGGQLIDALESLPAENAAIRQHLRILIEVALNGLSHLQKQ